MTPLRASLLLAALAVTAGCPRAVESPAAKAAALAQRDRVQARDAAHVAAQEQQNHTFSERMNFVTGMQERLILVRKQCDALATRLASAGRSTQAEAAPRLELLENQVRRINRRLDEAVNATPASWGVSQQEAEKNYVELQRELAATQQWLSRRLTP